MRSAVPPQFAIWHSLWLTIISLRCNGRARDGLLAVAFFVTNSKRLRRFWPADASTERILLYQVSGFDMAFGLLNHHRLLLLNGGDYTREGEVSQEKIRPLQGRTQEAGRFYICPGETRAGSRLADILPRPPSVDGAALLAEENIVGENNTKTNIVVEVVRVVPVTNCTTNVVSIVVPRTTAQHTHSHGLSLLTALIFSNLPANDRFQSTYARHVHID